MFSQQYIYIPGQGAWLLNHEAERGDGRGMFLFARRRRGGGGAGRRGSRGGGGGRDGESAVCGEAGEVERQVRGRR